MKSLNVATEPYLFLYCFALGVSLTITPQLMVSKVCHQMYNGTVCDKLSTGIFKDQEKVVFEKAASWNIINFSAVYIPSAFNTLFVGALSDILSKKMLLLAVPIFTTLQSVVYIISSHYQSTSIWLLAFGTSLTAVFADVQGAIMFAYSYLADVTDADKNRTARMNFLEGMIFLSLGIGSYCSGILLKSYGFVIAFSLSISASIANFIFVAFLLPDLKGQGNKEDPKISSTNSASKALIWLNWVKSACTSIFTFTTKYIFSWERRGVWLLLLAAFFTNSSVLGENVILIMFLKHTPLSLSSDQIGILLLILQFVRGFGVIIVALVSIRLFKLSDPCVILIGQISIMSVFVAIGISSKLHMLFAVTPLAIGFPLAMSGLRSSLTKLVLPEEHGIALSFVAFVSLIGLSIMTFAANKLFQATATYFTGTCIIMLAAVCLVGFFVTLIAFYSKGAMPTTILTKENSQKEETVALLTTTEADKQLGN